jgi:hypothetical protein
MNVVRTAVTIAVTALAASGTAASAADSAPPRVRITTADHSVAVGGVPDMGAAGTASDDTAVRNVRVLYCGNASTANDTWTCGTGIAGTSVVQTVDARLSCPSSRRSCTWTSTAPLRPDHYLVFATAYDTSGKYTIDGPILLTVV